MCEAQSLFDELAGPLCPEQLTAPVLHKVQTRPDTTRASSNKSINASCAQGLSLTPACRRAYPAGAVLPGPAAPHLGRQGRGLARRRHSTAAVQGATGAGAGEDSHLYALQTRRLRNCSFSMHPVMNPGFLHARLLYLFLLARAHHGT